MTSIPTRALYGLTLALLLLPGSSLGQEVAEQSPDDGLPRTRWFGYVGAFFVTNITTQVNVFSSEVPVGARVDLLNDLDLDDALIVPRAEFFWSVRPRHVVGFSYYDLTQSSRTVLDRTIEIGDKEFPEGTEIYSRFENSLLRAQYTWLFHRDEKVELGIGGGLFVADLGIRLATTSEVTNSEADEGLTAPLPVIGGRFSYALGRRLRFLFTGDLFLLNYDAYHGTLLDMQAFLSHRTSRHVGFVVGLDFQTLDATFDDDEFTWELTNGFRGFFTGITLYF